MIYPEARITTYMNDRRQITFAWEGEGDIAVLSVFALEELGYPDPQIGDVLSMGELRLQVVDVPAISLSVWVVQAGSPVAQQLRRGWYRALSWLELVYYRILKTAWVWNLLDREEGKILSWRDLKVVKWLSK